MEKPRIVKINPGFTHTQIDFDNNSGWLIPNEGFEDVLDALLEEEKNSRSKFEIAFQDINNIINSTGNSMRKYAKIVDVMAGFEAPGALRRIGKKKKPCDPDGDADEIINCRCVGALTRRVL
jgi:hypothetical protein